VRAQNQFRVSDGRIRGKGPLAFREFQSGLWFANGKAKPSARSFANPIVVRRAGRSRVLVWGQARVDGAHRVTIQRRAPSSKRFEDVASVRTDRRGYFRKLVPRRVGDYRFRWSDGGGKGMSEVIRISR
jgi:hypothetical protein